MLAAPSAAHDYKIGSIRVIHPWSRATPPVVPVAGGYLRLINLGEEPDRLLAVSSEIAEKVELHESTVTDGIARMRPLPGGLTINAGETVELKLGQAHIMFIKPIRPLKEGERFEATLLFEKAGSLMIEFMVQGMGAQPAGKSGHEGHGAPPQ
ncbi:MAG: copper chaperone PCu(A)C [Pseudolabrys sp.]|nr:copper chaperone PCu(A)C [Pseudolabrys sp.]